MMEFEIKYDNCVSYASDGANVVSGATSGVWSFFKAKNPNIFQIKCVDHSLALALKHAFEAHIHTAIATLLHKVPAYFSRSQCRRKRFLEIQALFQELGEVLDANPFLRYNDTRWLGRYEVMKRIVANWDALTFYLTEEDSKGDFPIEVHDDIDRLVVIFKDRSKLALCRFLVQIFKSIEDLNKDFQTASVEGALRACQNLENYMKSLKGRIFNQAGENLQEKVY